MQIPQPAEPWEGIRDDFKEGDMASQTGLLQTKSYSGNEDCLSVSLCLRLRVDRLGK